MICVLFWAMVKPDLLLKVLDKGKIANMQLVRVRNNSGDIFYIPDSLENGVQSSVRINIRRYDLLAVGEIINDRSLEGIQGSYWDNNASSSNMDGDFLCFQRIGANRLSKIEDLQAQRFPAMIEDDW